MAATFNIASSLSNRIGDDRYYAAVDYDGAALEAVEADAKRLQSDFGFSDAWVYRTKNGWHAHFFNDNRLTHAKLAEALASSALADPLFKESFLREQEGGKRVTMRAAGKHAEADVEFFKVVPGLRKPSVEDRNMGTSLRLMYDTARTEPLIDHSRFALAASQEPAAQPVTEVPVPAREKPAVPAAPEAAAPAPAPEFFEEAREKTVASVRPGWEKVGARMKSWYRGALGRTVGRLVSAASRGCELAFVVPPDLKGAKADGLHTTRPFFFDNHPAQEKMLAPYSYAVEHGKLEDAPLNFFMSHARFDLSALVGRAGFHDFAGRRALGDDMSKRFAEYVTGFDLIFDVDSKDPDACESWEESKKLRDALAARGVPFSLNFSGSKGFHFRVHADDLNAAAPRLLAAVKADPEGAVRRAHAGLLRFAETAGAKVDEKAYNGVHRAIIRVPWSVHQATGAVAKPLTDAEFNALAGVPLRTVQRMMLPESLLAGDRDLGVRKFDPQRSEFVVRALAGGEWLTWEEMRDSGAFDAETDVPSSDGKRKLKEWERIRAEQVNPATKELRRLNDADRNALSKAFASGMVQGCRVERGAWIDLVGGDNWDYRRAGSHAALSRFVDEIMS